MQQILPQSSFDEILSSKQLIQKYIDSDPHTLALKGVGSTICTQIKYLQRARKKLPSYFTNCCIIPSLSFEQSSSEATASVKDFGKGELAIDLTCGLGVDTLYMSHLFDRVITIERDRVLSLVANENLSRLGRSNIEVVNSDAESFLSSLPPNTEVDLIYIDPARRDHAKKVFLLEDCSPKMEEIMPLASKLAKRIMVKLSPLFDIDAAYNYFHKWGSCSMESVSYGGECKELLVTISPSNNSTERNSVNVVKAINSSNRYHFDITYNLALSSCNTKSFKYLYIADVAFYKSRTTAQLMSTIYNTTDYSQSSQNAPIFSNVLIDSFEGHSYQIIECHPYKPKELRKLLKGYNNRAKVLIKEFKFTTSQIKKELNIKDAELPIMLFSSTNLYILKEIGATR